MLKKARSKGFTGNIEYACKDIVSTGFDGETFDAVLCYASFPHFPDKPRALGEINRILRKNGRLFICHSASRERINQIHQGIPVMHRDLIPDEDEMRRMLLLAGFAEIQIFDNLDNYLVRAKKSV